MNPHYESVARRARHRCEYCHAPEAVFNFPFEVEHAYPTCRGGSDDASNLCLSCRACNLRKGSRVTYPDQLTNQEVDLFNPRSHTWEDHFTVDAESGQIHGRTAIGRATEECLDLNHPLQVAARQLWLRLRMFP